MERDNQTGTTYEQIAIVGIGCRFPGGIISPATFWEFLLRGEDGTSEVPDSRWSLERHYDAERGKPGKLYTRRGGFIRDVKGFDPQFFGISPREAASMDPQQRLLLETTWEAFEDAGIPAAALARKKVGVFVGLFTHDYENLHMRTSERHLQSPHSATGMSTTISANRISFAFDFMGPSMIIDTACSSSLVAVHLAARALQSGEAEIAVAGGVNLQLSPEMTMALSNASMLSPDGRSMSFDARANGYARADGVATVVLKPLANAQRDGDPVYAVIAGSAVNQDGHTPGISVPNGEAQQIVMREALAAAGISGGAVTYVEAHGTGTPVGDPIEARALGSVLSADAPDRSPCVIGSIKSNFGHAESAAGVAGLIKVALMQHHGRIPANLHFETPNPDIPFQDLRLRVPVATEDWPVAADGRRFAGINSFGFGGTNAHVIIARAPEPVAEEESVARPRETHILTLSARSQSALQDGAANLETFLRSPEAAQLELGEIAAALALGRSHLDERLLIATHNHATGADLLAAFRAGNRAVGVVQGTAVNGTQPMAFLCSGMGQQWWGMGRSLLASEPVFAAKVAEIDALFSRLGNEHTLAELFAADEQASQIDRTQCAQRAIFAVQAGLAALWESVGIRPDFVVGHSVGEVAAAYIAGALSLEDAVTISFHRSRLQARLAGCGGMLAVGLSEGDVRPYLEGIEDAVSLAAVNSPGSITLAGDAGALQRLQAQFESRQIFARMLNVEVPYHSPAMDRITDEIRDALQGILPIPTRIPLVSTVTGTIIDGTSLDGDYWVRNVREPVFFRKAMQSLTHSGCTVFVELGAHPVLATSISECLAADRANGVVIASQRRKQDDSLTFWSAFGQIFCRGTDIPFDRIYRRTGMRIALPTYPWQRASYWLESVESSLDRTGRPAEDRPKSHPLLGDRQVAPKPTWRAGIGPGQPAFLKDHKVQDSVVFPGAGFVEAALAACREETGGSGPLVLDTIRIEAPLVLGESAQTYLQTSFGDGRTFEIHSVTGRSEDQRWSRHVTGITAPVQDTKTPPPLDIAALQASLPQTENGTSFYARFDDLRLDYGPSFQNVDQVWIGKDTILGRLHTAPRLEQAGDTFIVHPAMLDSAFQLLAGLPEKGTFLPVGISRITVYRPGETLAWAYVQLTAKTKSRIEANIAVADESGGMICMIEGLACQLFESQDRAAVAAQDDFLFANSWVEAPLQTSPHQHDAASLPDLDGLSGRLKARHLARDAEGVYQRTVREFWPELDALALDYFAEALTELGWSWHVGQTLAVRELMATLGIVHRHQSYVARMIGLLARSGRLNAEQGAWRVEIVPESGSAAKRWRELVSAYPHGHAELVLMQRCGTALARFLRDEDDVHFALFPKGCPIAEHLYTDGPTLKPYNRIVADLVREVVAQLPECSTLRILEVGAGTGSLAAHLLPLLPPERTDYVFTELSEHFLGQARQRFSNRAFVRYEKFDLEADPEEQGFAADSFDLVLASDVLHATSDILASLTRLRTLLKPGGAVALVELTAPCAWHDLVFGLLPGWWAFADRDRRKDHATLPVEGWMDAFAEAGFGRGQAIADKFGDLAAPHSVLLATKPIAPDASAVCAPGSPAPHVPGASRPVIVMGDEAGLAKPLSSLLSRLGANVRIIPGDADALQDALLNRPVALGDGVMRETPVIVDLCNLDRTTADDRDKEAVPSVDAMRRCVDLQSNLEALTDLRNQGRHTLWMVTRGAQRVGEATGMPDLAAAALWGFARTAFNEVGDVETRLADLSTEPQPDEIAALACEILSDTRDPEIALRQSRRYVSRVHRWTRPRLTDDAQTVYELRRSPNPRPDDLVFHEAVVPPPGANEVQLRIRASGINFKDFALLSGLVSAEAGSLGLEASGTVLSIGPGVTDFAPGDAVFGLVQDGMNGVINVSAKGLVHKPDSITFEEAAGIPVAFLSAYHALKQQAGLRAGQTVLIHTAASGLGLAAIAVARALGAKILATAGTPEKRAYLDALGIDYVGDSRTPQFASEVMAHTDGVGVDVVLNTLSAVLNEHNFALLKPRTGCLIDLANVHNESRLAYSNLVRGLTVTAFDLIVLAHDDVGYLHDLLAELAGLFASGALRPLPFRPVSIERLSDTLHSVRSAGHIGKLIISHADSQLHLVPASSQLELADDGCYLITGGLSGIGLTMAQWFARCGARHLVLIGRRGAATVEAAPVLAALKTAGIAVHAIACDVGDRAQIAALASRFGRDLPCLRGIVHGAMVLRDGPLRDMSHDDIASVLRPKADGAWYLHQLTLDQPLDFFICHSSFSNLVGNRDQANYAAANMYLETLMDYRRSQGLPGLAIGWGMIGETGTVAGNQEQIDVFLRQGVYGVPLEKAWATITTALRNRLAFVAAIMVDWRKLGKFARVIANTPRFSLVAPSGAGGGGNGQGADGQDMSGDSGAQDVAARIVHEVATILGLAPEAVLADKPLSELGFDSLMAVELSVALELATGQGFSRMSLLRADLTTGDLIATVQEQNPEPGLAVKAAPVSPPAPDAPRAVDVEALSDAEVEALLQELSSGE